MSLWDALRMNMMISYQELVRTFLSKVNAIPIVKKAIKPVQIFIGIIKQVQEFLSDIHRHFMI